MTNDRTDRGEPLIRARGLDKGYRRGEETAHVLRGLHFQKSNPQAKLVTVLRGKVFDVAVDLRPGSRTQGQWYGTLLSDQERTLLFLPEGFAHGFLSLADDTLVLYKCSDYYHPEDEAGIRYDDPTLAIQWPVDASTSLILSDKDLRLPLLSDAAPAAARDLPKGKA